MDKLLHSFAQTFFFFRKAKIHKQKSRVGFPLSHLCQAKKELPAIDLLFIRMVIGFPDWSNGMMERWSKAHPPTFSIPAFQYSTVRC
jgi:hypothetical protein